MQSFFNMLAWVFGVLSTSLLIARLIGAATYSDLDKLCDSMRGVEMRWPVAIPGTIAIICWSWVIAA